jgi:hypothetical protein
MTNPRAWLADWFVATHGSFSILLQEDSSCSETCALDGEDALETDPRLAELAFHTARSVHEIQGLVFDETSGDELVTQLEFKVVKIGLPLGCT